VKDITLVDRWVISAQERFTKKTDLFPVKFSKSVNRCPMKAFVRDGHWYFTTKYIHYRYLNGNAGFYITGFEKDLLNFVLKRMNMPFVHVPTPEDFELET
jgi:hypothetical protein